MDYTEIEIEWMKDILKDKEEYIKKLEEEIKNLKSELSQYKEYNSNLMKEVKLCYKKNQN